MDLTTTPGDPADLGLDAFAWSLPADGSPGRMSLALTLDAEFVASLRRLIAEDATNFGHLSDGELQDLEGVSASRVEATLRAMVAIRLRSWAAARLARRDGREGRPAPRLDGCPMPAKC